MPLPMTEQEKRDKISKEAVREVEAWSEAKKLMFRVGKYADAEEEAKAVKAAYRHPDCGCRLE